MAAILGNFKEIGEIQRNSKNKHMWEILQFVKNKGKFIVRTTEILNKIYKKFNVKI